MTHPSIAVVTFSADMVGGMGIQAQTLVGELRKEGYSIRLIPFDPRFPRPFQRVRQCPYVRTLLNQALYLPSLRHLRDADVVHVFSAQYWSFLLGPVPAILEARRLGKRIVVHYHSGLAEDHLARWGRFVHPWLRLVDEIVVPSESLRRAFADHGYQALVIPNVVDTSRFRFRERLPLRPRLLSTRNLEPYYRVDTTLEAFALLSAKYPDATLTIAGYGSQEARLRRLAGSIGAGRVRFLGRVEPAAMPACYDNADIFLNASIVDAQPVSVLEAFAAGLPVVSTGTGDIAAMVRDGQTGVVVPSGNPDAMAKAVSGLLSDPDRAVLLARHARHEVEKYTWTSVRKAWAAVHLGQPAAFRSSSQRDAERADDRRTRLPGVGLNHQEE